MFLLAKKLMVLFLLIGAFSTSLFAIPANCEYIQANDTLDGLTSKDKVCVVAFVAEAMSETLPMTVDAATILENVIASGDILNYKYSVTLSKDIGSESMKAIGQMMDENITNANCTTPEVRDLINLDITLEHNYYNDKGIFQFRIIVNKAKCQKIGLK